MKPARVAPLPLLFGVLHVCLAQADFAPYFFDNGPYSSNGNMALFSLSEDTPVGTQIYCLNGSDPEGQEVSYGVSFDPGSKEYFGVNPKTGNITLVHKLDREKEDSFDVMVSITDGRSKVVERVTIFVMDANDEKPEFQNMPAIIDVLETTESGNSIFKAEALDKDTGSGGSVTYYLLNTQSALFAIDRHSGVIRIKLEETLDYEKAKTHFVVVVAKDGGGTFNGKEQFLSSSATLTINVIDAQDTPPSFIGTPYFAYVYEVSSPGSEIFTVAAKDGDVGNPNPIRYSFVEGDDGVFSINETTGRITLLTSPAFLKREIFNIKVKASEISPDGRLLDYGETAVVIRVVDLNNNPPTFYGENGTQSTFELTMYEHPPEGEILRGLKITVNDSDQGANAKFNLRLIGPGRMLRVVPQTVLNEAQVTILVEDSASMDYEKHHFLTYKLLAVEIDTPERFSSTADIIVHLLDTNDNVPKFSSDYYIARIPENSPGGSNVVSVLAIDPDSGPWGDVTYSIYGSGADLFLIQSSTGIIYTQPWASLDAEVRSKYNFYVKAEDSEGRYSLAEVFVTVLDLNDHPPAFNDNFLEKTMVIGAPVKIEAVDDDAEIPNNVIEYAIMKAEPDNNIFDIDADTGEINLKSYIKSMAIIKNITNQRDFTWSLVVQARDRGQPSFSTTAVVKIDITEAAQLKGGPLGSLLMHNKNKPMQIVGGLAGVISLMVTVTVFISTVTFVRNKKSNRVVPNRRVRRRPRNQHAWTFRNPFRRAENPEEKFQVEEEEQDAGATAENVNHNNNVGNAVRHWPPPHSAPRLPPPPPPPPCIPAERKRAVPTVSAAVAARPKKKSTTPDSVNKALVSELKMRLEQKRIRNHL
ncbi:cadherin-related family member 1 isoform X1 [Syngnathoides biaculeatus]|uniref:cadherin-related family member 1 isoform X1 n=2 Tax=Syngnathoides biaculeatus TaxID=300417 RepID=UPI002ADE3AE6|nr:cadherin-related family member 1 isoform X1 [Syngnathoides biaculeatus]XP_061692279.1 cadherin-related family member 1 isoform X1 [Syngnathoides biaculeatus]